MTEETKSTRKPAAKRTGKTPDQSRVKLAPEEDRQLGRAGNPDKYAKQPKIGTPTLGRSTNYVDTVGLGKLKVRSAHGYTDV